MVKTEIFILQEMGFNLPLNYINLLAYYDGLKQQLNLLTLFSGIKMVYLVFILTENAMLILTEIKNITININKLDPATSAKYLRLQFFLQKRPTVSTL